MYDKEISVRDYTAATSRIIIVPSCEEPRLLRGKCFCPFLELEFLLKRYFILISGMAHDLRGPRFHVDRGGLFWKHQIW